MATREGIYVGGKDIIERYVGDKLVWSKWVYIGWFQYLYNPIESGNYLIFDLTAKGGRFNNNYRDEDKVKEIKIRINHSNDTIATVYAKYVYTTDKNLKLYVKFLDDNQKQIFKSNFAYGDSLYFYFK